MAATLAGQAPFTLKYLFTAYFADGTMIEQTPEDCSAIDPAKSAFYDVLARDGLIAFGLSNGAHHYQVDLRDGVFALDYVPFEAQPCSRDEMPPGGTFRLIYFRDHRQEMNVSMDALGDHHIAYRFGWEYEAAGKIWRQTIVLR